MRNVVVNQFLVDFVRENIDVLFAATSTIIRILARVNRTGGLPGGQINILVRGVIAFSKSEARIFHPLRSVVGTMTGSAPARRTMSG